MAAHKPEFNVLALNDDCLKRILNFLSLMDLCTTSEIPTIGVEFSDNERILKHFGDRITSSSFLKHKFPVSLNEGQVSLIFEWLGKYCTETVERFVIAGIRRYTFPPTAIAFLSNVRSVEFCYPLSSDELEAAFGSGRQLNILKLYGPFHHGPFHFANHRMPHLKTLEYSVHVNSPTDFDQIDSFFRNHTQLDDLLIEFRNNQQSHYAIDLSFLSHLSDLTKLRLILNGSKVKGTASLSHLNSLWELIVDGSYDKETDLEILERLGSVESLVTLEVTMPDVSHVLRGIERFKNLTYLRIFGDGIVDISSLAQLRSNCTELEVCCKMLTEPNSLVDVVRNLNKLEAIKLDCQVALSETVCTDLAKVCSSQDRKIFIVLENVLLAKVGFDFSFIERFNENNEKFVDIRFFN
ncbi:hypothetical protein Bhyg_04766 [Pseudolycoriella hygida]|uniref:Uncharacterized protein n=1 Tax=Pseudolycoriella hygida TaxID=35572 RepID=A0A9Q0NG17_9DIPT|nr:hypothetical protein Bhyg_04766 [Pseudolycoriella hygida]